MVGADVAPGLDPCRIVLSTNGESGDFDKIPPITQRSGSNPAPATKRFQGLPAQLGALFCCAEIIEILEDRSTEDRHHRTVRATILYRHSQRAGVDRRTHVCHVPEKQPK